MPERRTNNSAISAQALANTAKLYGPMVAVLVTGAIAWVTLDLTVDALAGDSKKHEEKIRTNQQAIAVIKLEAAVRAARDEALQDTLKEIKDAVKALAVRPLR